jgi:FMN reductase
MFSYLHAIVSPTGVYASTDDFGPTERQDSLSRRIDKAGDDFARLLTSCGHRQPRDVFNEDLHAMEALLSNQGL